MRTIFEQLKYKERAANSAKQRMEDGMVEKGQKREERLMKVK